MATANAIVNQEPKNNVVDTILAKEVKELVNNDNSNGESETFETLKDSDSHSRFVEGSGTEQSVSGITSTYCRWALNGTNLSLVYAFKVAKNTTAKTNANVVLYAIPTWCLDKIYTFSANTDKIANEEIKAYNYLGSRITDSDTNATFFKQSNGIAMHIDIVNNTSSDAYYRIKFDLIIDNE